MWQERVSPRGEGEKMKALLTAKVGMFLVVSSVLAVWTLLAAQHVQAHSLTDPSCRGLPTAETFLQIQKQQPLTLTLLLHLLLHLLQPTQLRQRREPMTPARVIKIITTPRLRSPH